MCFFGDSVTYGEFEFTKTSTGFGTGGATFEDVGLMKQAVGDRIRIKAAGGIRNLETALSMIQRGGILDWLYGKCCHCGGAESAVLMAMGLAMDGSVF